VNGTPAILARGLSKRFGASRDATVVALDDVTFELPQGSALAVVGENGSGKSTLLDLLLGLTRPSHGALTISGPVAALLELGAGFFHELTGRENAMQLALLAGASGRDARTLAQSAGEFAELGEFFDRPVRTYSAGMLMRLGFAVASSLDAPVVLVDEVLAVGDGYFQRKCIDRLVAMRQRGATLVVASHDLHALQALCDRGLWLRQGRVAGFGPAGEVVTAYEGHLRRRMPVAELAPGVGGTGEIVVHAVRLTDGDGVERSELRTGDTLRVQVEFSTTRPVNSPVMGVAFFRDDGIYCSGPNTLFDGQLSGELDGSYVLTATFEELPLLRGSYQASVSFYDRDHVYAYAWHHRMYPFSIRSEQQDHGLVLLRHRFELRPVDSGNRPVGA
jgi:lipopolysaccharide transport system ATP-binding protein